MECNNNNSNSRSSSSSKRSSSTPANSRWNPTSLQINLLEGLYNQGLRTPTPDQIQQIAAMLSAYGHIEGKNVFYWFQNHKARQRQKLKQDIIDITTTATNHHNSNNNNHNLPFINHHQYFLRNSHLPPPHHQPTAASAPPMMCGSYYAPEADEVKLRRRPQHPNNVVVVPAGSGFKGMRKAQTSSDKIKRTVAASAAAAYHDHHRTVPDAAGLDVHDDHDHQTLPLFPLHPTGGLLGRANLSSSSPPPSYVIPDNNSSSIDDTGVSGDDNTTTAAVGCCFDFFSLGQSHVCPPHRF